MQPSALSAQSHIVQFSAARDLLFLVAYKACLSFSMILQVWQNLVCPSLDPVLQSVSSSYTSFCRAMEDLRAELNQRIDSRFGQFAKQLHDKSITAAALRRLTAEELRNDYKIPEGAAESIAAAFHSSGEPLLWQNPFCLLHDSWSSCKSREESAVPTEASCHARAPFYQQCCTPSPSLCSFDMSQSYPLSLKKPER